VKSTGEVIGSERGRKERREGCRKG